MVPLYVVFGGDRTVPETEITDYPAFFDELRAAETLPTTSQPSVGDFRAAYEPLLADGREIVSIHISGGLSGTPEAARQAKESLEREGIGGGRIQVIDSDHRRRRARLHGAGRREGRARRHGRRSRWRRTWRTRARSSRCGSRSTRSSSCAAAGASAPPARGSGPR